MYHFALRYPASVIVGKHRLTADDILLLRKHMFPRGLVSHADAEQLLALHRCVAEKCIEWDNWFVEMMTAFIVVHSHPKYSLDESNAQWLIATVSVDGAITNAAELELVLHAIEMADAVPDILSAFALDQLRIALQRQKGAYAMRRGVRRSGIAAPDIEFLYRILRGSLYAGKMVLSAAEVAVLDRIDAIVHNATNHPSWNALIRSIAVRAPDGHVTATPWLQMLVDDEALDQAA